MLSLSISLSVAAAAVLSFNATQVGSERAERRFHSNTERVRVRLSAPMCVCVTFAVCKKIASFCLCVCACECELGARVSVCVFDDLVCFGLERSGQTQRRAALR